MNHRLLNPSALLLALACLGLSACQPDEGPSQQGVDLSATNADTETCTACGMVIREQPAPRGQLIRRDGTREFLCSIDDLVQYLEVPSPNGKPAKVFAEVMPDDHDQSDMSTAAQAWGEVADVYFVIGLDRGAVMGGPALTYQTQEAAEQAAKKFGGKVVTFEQLREANRK